MNAIISLHGVRKLYPASRSLFRKAKSFVHAVDKVDLEIPAGSMFGLVGESGCGKSTLGNLIVGLEKVTSGEILFKEERISDLTYTERRKKNLTTKIQMVFQNPGGSLSPRKSIEFLLAEPLLVNGLARNLAAARHTISQLLEKVKLDKDVLHKFPHQLSGGQQQRVCIARALALSPEFVVLDEPTSALDVSVQAKILNLLSSLKREINLTCLFISHDINVVNYLCDNVAVMYLGEFVEITRAPISDKATHHPYTQLLLQSSSGRYTERIGEPPSAIDLPQGCRFADRCRWSRAECCYNKPQLVKIAEGSSIRCFGYNDENVLQ